jgi:hypothetical protein
LGLKWRGKNFCEKNTKLLSLELPIRKVTFCKEPGFIYTEWTETLPRSQTFSAGLTESFDANWFKTIGHCRFESENLTKFVREKSIPFEFRLFEVLEVLEIDDRNELQNHWTTITEGIVQVSSPNFKKIVMTTDYLS